MTIKWTRTLVESKMGDGDGYKLMEIIRGKKATHFIINCPNEIHPPQEISTRTFSRRIEKGEKLCDICTGRKHHNFNKIMPKEKLYKLYVVKNMSSAKIAESLGKEVTRQHINYLLRKYGIPRKQKHQNRKRPLQEKISKDDLYYLYIIEQKSQAEIAKEYNVNSRSISYLMSIYGIKSRGKTEANN